MQRLQPVADIAGRQVLEIGCGRGSLTRWLIGQPQRPVRLVAADVSETAIRAARAAASELGLPPVGWQICDIQALPFLDEVFDTVISCETIEHVPDPRRAVCELARVLRPGGRLLLTTPNYLGPMGLYRGYLRLTGRRYTETGQPINRFTLLPVTRAWVRRAGLEVEGVDGRGHYLPVPGRPPVEVPALGHPQVIMRWFGLHSLVIARKPHGSLP
jgi:SAM-dependent methyltransferase